MSDSSDFPHGALFVESEKSNLLSLLFLKERKERKGQKVRIPNPATYTIYIPYKQWLDIQLMAPSALNRSGLNNSLKGV